MEMEKMINIRSKILLVRVICNQTLKRVNVESASMPSTSMGDQEGNSDSEVEEVDDETAQFMASLANRDSGGVMQAFPRMKIMIYMMVKRMMFLD